MNSIVRGATVACLLVVLSVPAHAQVLRQLTDGTSGSDPLWALDDTGYVLFMDIEADPFGTNPEQSLQLYRIAFPGSIVSQVGSFSQGLAGGSVSCTDDGGQALVISPSDPLGMNHDRSLELFLVEADGTGMVQLTSDPAPNAGSVLEARIAGSGSVAAFLADIDPFGTNPDHAVQLFVVDTATLAVTQVTTATTGEFRGFSISDDGDRVVFAHHGDPIPGSVTGGTPELFTFVVSISLRKQATVASSVRNPVISGNGEKIAFNDSGEVVVRDWFGTTTVVIGPGWAPTITDDGEWVYFEAEDFAEIVQIWVADTGGAGPPVDITQTTDPWGNYGPIVSGNNTRIAFVTSGGEIGDGLVVMDVDGTNVDDVILPSWEERPGGSWPVITADGSLILYYPGGLWSMRVFESWADITGQNPDTDRQVFKVHSDGTGLVQVSPGDCETLHPTVSADAGVVTTFSTCDWTGENPGIDPEVFAVSLDGGAHVQITYNDSFEWRFPRISENGEWVTYEGSGQIQRARTDHVPHRRRFLQAGYLRGRLPCRLHLDRGSRRNEPRSQPRGLRLRCVHLDLAADDRHHRRLVVGPGDQRRRGARLLHVRCPVLRDRAHRAHGVLPRYGGDRGRRARRRIAGPSLASGQRAHVVLPRPDGLTQRGPRRLFGAPESDRREQRSRVRHLARRFHDPGDDPAEQGHADRRYLGCRADSRAVRRNSGGRRRSPVGAWRGRRRSWPGGLSGG
jgi:Tol biopolymer transport system component